MFNGINSLEFLAIPFFLLAGDMMTAANITERLIRLAQVFVGHFRSGLAHVVSLSSMLFAGISGSMTADVAAISTVVMPYMKREGYDPAFSAALVASASTIAAMVPPSIMAIVYGAVGNVSIAGLFLGGATPGLMVGVGLMIYSYLFGPPGIKKPRATLGEMAVAGRAALLPLMIPIIIIGGVVTGTVTPAEAGMIAVVYILVVLLPLMNRGHIRHLPRDFMEAAVLYSLPMSAVAAASAVGWLLAYLGGPDIVRGWIEAVAGDNRIAIMYLMVVVLTIAGDFLDGVPAIAIFMPINRGADPARPHQPGAHGRAHHREPRLWPDHAALRADLAIGRDARRGAVRAGPAPVGAALRDFLPRHHPDHPVPRRRALAAPAGHSPVGRMLPEPERRGLHLPAQLGLDRAGDHPP